jgi:uncharacterized membrane protein YjdF
VSWFLRLSHSRFWRYGSWTGEILLVAAVVYAAVERQWISAVELNLFLIAAFVFLQLRDPLPALFEFLFVVAALMNAGGYAFDWFGRIGPYDTIVHGFTPFAITLTFGFLLYRERLPAFEEKRWLFVITILSFGMAIGAAWEVVEWGIDLAFGTALQPSLNDTDVDLLADIAGALGAALLANWGLPDHIQRQRQKRAASA